MPVINVLNKIDRFPAPDAISGLMNEFPDSAAISAHTGEGVEPLLARIEQGLETQMVSLDVLIPYKLGELVDLFHRRGLIEEEEHTETGTRIVGRRPSELAGRFRDLDASAPGN